MDEIFAASAAYMHEMYDVWPGSEWAPQYQQDEALDTLGWDVDTMGWDEAWWADVLIHADGRRLTIVADGAWGQPSTHYPAVKEG